MTLDQTIRRLEDISKATAEHQHVVSDSNSATLQLDLDALVEARTYLRQLKEFGSCMANLAGTHSANKSTEAYPVPNGYEKLAMLHRIKPTDLVLVRGEHGAYFEPVSPSDVNEYASGFRYIIRKLI